jgi:hypothetical protein
MCAEVREVRRGGGILMRAALAANGRSTRVRLCSRS